MGGSCCTDDTGIGVLRQVFQSKRDRASKLKYLAIKIIFTMDILYFLRVYENLIRHIVFGAILEKLG